MDMNSVTNAPEKIWAWARNDNWCYFAHCTSEEEHSSESDEIYIRADIHQALEEECEALREAIKDARDYVRDCASGGLQIVSRVHPPQCQETLDRIDEALRWYRK